MLVLFLLLIIVAMALGILGVVVKGLLYLLFTGIGVLLVAFLLGALWMRRRTRRRRRAR
jgi:TM2 domain-containing membrane protein YozV